MADCSGKEKAVTADTDAALHSYSGHMVYEQILGDGIFRFDCSVDDRVAAYPSLSFVSSKDRDTPIFTQTHSFPSYVPTFHCVLGQQIVRFQPCMNGRGFFLVAASHWYILLWHWRS
uniref:Alpha-glucosidase 2 n=1 Tax=Rhizophora mucronata TaxID=61149 RepID=A0A2P2J884_RHIMU